LQQMLRVGRLPGSPTCTEAGVGEIAFPPLSSVAACASAPV